MPPLVRCACYAGGSVFWIAAQTGRNRVVAQLYIYSAVVIGTVYALCGLVAELSGGQTIVGLEKWAYQDSLTSTFVNRNSFATFAGLAAVAALGMAISTIQTEEELASARARQVVRQPSRYSLASILCAIALVILILALVLDKVPCRFWSPAASDWRPSCGRGSTGRGRLPGLPILVGGIIISVVVVLVAAGGGTFERKTEEDGAALSGRPWLFQRTMIAIADQPGTGHGGGCLRKLLPDLQERRVWWSLFHQQGT